MIAMEALSSLLLKTRDVGFLTGFKVGGRESELEEISHLLLT